MALSSNRLTRSVRRLLRTPLFLDRRHHHAGRRDRRQCGHLQRRQRRAAEAACRSHDPDRLVGVWHTAPGINIPLLNMGPSNYFVYRDEGRTFEDIGLWDGTAVSITGIGRARTRAGAAGHRRHPPHSCGWTRSSGGISRSEDDSPGAADTVMLMHAFWQRKFGGDPAAVGKSMTIDGKPYQIIGVLPGDVPVPGPQAAGAAAVPVRSRPRSSRRTSATRGSRA